MYSKQTKVFFTLLLSIAMSKPCSAQFAKAGNIADRPNVTIGNQRWCSIELNRTYFSNGDTLTQAFDLNHFNTLSKNNQPAYYVGTCSASPIPVYYYNWAAISDSRKLAPYGFRIPTSNDYIILSTAVNNENHPLMSTSWKVSPGYTAPTNSTGFSALPLGTFSDSKSGIFNCTAYGFWWTSSVASSNNYYVFSIDPGIPSGPIPYGDCGIPVRCIKDTSVTPAAPILTYIHQGYDSLGFSIMQNTPGWETSGICWSTIGSDPVVTPGSSIQFNPGQEKIYIPGLKPNTSYNIRSWVYIMGEGYFYGEEFNKGTSSGLPGNLKITLSDITSTTATVTTRIIMPTSAKLKTGVCWSLSKSPSFGDHCQASSGADSSITVLTGLPLASKIYVRAYATYLNTSSWSNQIEFTNYVK